MNYYCLTCPKNESEEKNEILMARLAELGFESFEEDDNELKAYIQEKDFSKNLLAGIECCKDLIAKNQLKIDWIPDQNWNAVWESNYPSVLIAERCYIRAPFHEEKPEIEFSILVKPKMAFGTAHHETTAQILEYILDADVEGKEVLDMGCGTAVLAILASMKGAKHIDAIDNDEWAFNNSSENIELNHCDNITAFLGDASLLTEKEKYDTIFANINKNILLQDMHAYADSLKPGGSIYFSGFYESDLTDIQNHAAKLNLNYSSHIVKNDWTAALFEKAVS
ncbi:MAG: 50S ribosomal protein L11 methyltransferase [Bacteroidales bacterium]|nr:50S ribosomal protein L11 methyltransferase [Bacteroidales bacterium]